MDRRTFLQLTGVGVGTMVVPVLGFPRTLFGATTPIPTADKKTLADVALNAARAKGATYADVRIGRYLNQFVIAREDKVQNVVNTESYGAGVRVLANGTWGFAATSQLSPDSIARAAEEAVAIAKANSKLGGEPVVLAPVKGAGAVAWRTPIAKNPFDVPIKEKADLLLGVNSAAQKAGASFINSSLFLVNEQKYFASTDGSYIDQDVFRLWPNFTVTAVDAASGKFKTRNALSAPVGMGWEYMAARPEDKIPGITTHYGKSYDMTEDAVAAAKQAKEMHTCESVKPGKYDLVLDPTHTFLTIHESVGHATELDRVLGYEANFAGTSFATLDKWKSKAFNYGSKVVNFFADKTQEGSLGAVAYDDEGVKTKRWDLIKDGILVNYQAIRDQVRMIDQNESHGCCYAQSWSDVQFQRMPNVSLLPGTRDIGWDDIIAATDRGIAIEGDGSFSIDQQRYNAQFGGQVFHEIRNGKIVGQLKDVAYQMRTPDFWNSMDMIGGQKSYFLGGAFNDGKGQPPQSNAVSHGCVPSRFRNINVINTGRKA